MSQRSVILTACIWDIAQYYKPQPTLAKQHSLVPAVFTFATHPKQAPLLCTNEERLEHMRTCGIRFVYLYDFPSLQHNSPQTFVRDILIKEMQTQIAVSGETFISAKTVTEQRKRCNKPCKPLEKKHMWFPWSMRTEIRSAPRVFVHCSHAGRYKRPIICWATHTH